MPTSIRSDELVLEGEVDVYEYQAETDRLNLRDAGIAVQEYRVALTVLYGKGFTHFREIRRSTGCTAEAGMRILRYLDLHEEVHVDYVTGEVWHLPHTALQLCHAYHVHPGVAWRNRELWDGIRHELMSDLDGSLRGTDLKAHLYEFEAHLFEHHDANLVRLFVALCILEANMEESVSSVRYDLSKVREEEKEAEHAAT